MKKWYAAASACWTVNGLFQMMYLKNNGLACILFVTAAMWAFLAAWTEEK